MPEYGISGRKIEAYRGALMVALGRDVSWAEFARLADLNIHTIKGIRHGRSSGSTKTVHQITAMLRKHGIDMRSEDLLIPA